MFWTNFEFLCKSVGKAPNSVAKEVGIKSSGSVTAWKNGALPRQSAVNAIAKYFDVDANDLFLKDLRKVNKPAPTTGNELNPDYFKLSAVNKAIVDALIAQLSKSQSED